MLILCAFVSFAVLKKQQVVAKPVVVDAMKKVWFQELDNVEVKNTLLGGRRKLRHSEVWASKTFNEWHICNGYIIEKSIADLSMDLLTYI